jgi:hypothetical protein
MSQGYVIWLLSVFAPVAVTGTVAKTFNNYMTSLLHHKCAKSQYVVRGKNTVQWTRAGLFCRKKAFSKDLRKYVVP